MNIRQLTQDVRLRHWAEQMHSRQASGLSIRKWCREQGVSEKVYYYWQRKLREAAAKQITQEAVGTSQALIPRGWAQVDAADEAQNKEVATLPIEIGHCRIVADETTDSELLAKVCRVLVTLC